MKVYIDTDLEGVSGIVNEDQTFLEGRYHESARLALTYDVNAAVEGALEGGATDVLVNDGHDGGFNFVIDKLHEEARFLMGQRRGHFRPPGLDKSFNAYFQIGYHAMSGTEKATLDHTYSSRSISDMYLNGRAMGEIGIDAALAGRMGVPFVFITGCRKAVEEAKALVPNIEAVTVKEAISRTCAICLHPAKARKLIRQGAKRALEKLGQIKPFVVEPPIEFKILYQRSEFADAKPKIPGLERLDARTVRCKGDDLLTVARIIMGL